MFKLMAQFQTRKMYSAEIKKRDDAPYITLAV
jgi:hypothetical protein